MAELVEATLSFGLMLAGVSLGLAIRPMLPEHHRDQITLESVRLAVTMLVTFVALVLGLLTASSKGHFDAVSDSYREFGSDIVRLNGLLAEYGPETADARTLLRRYAAAVIASTWPLEPPPAGEEIPSSLARTFQGSRVENRAMGAILDEMEMQVRRLTPADAVRRQLAADALDAFKVLVRQRWAIIESAHSTISAPFIVVLLVWLAIVFFCFGLCARRNATVVIVAVLCAFSTASSIFVILDTDSPMDGQIAVPSQSMRNALTDIGR